MPRRNRRPIDEIRTARSPQSAGPLWAVAPEFDVRRVAGDKAYRCPGCEHEIRPGVWHLVVVPIDQPDERRHWHTECWRRELRRTRGR